MRQAFLIWSEAMVAETRAARLDLAARVPFTKPGRDVQESRAQLDALFDDAATTAARTTSLSLRHAAQRGLIQWG